MEKKFWRCNVCNDVHHGNTPPEVCPTCKAKNAYCQIDKNEATNLITDKVKKENQTSEQDILGRWKSFTSNNEFQLNPETSMVEMVAKGILRNELKHGLKMCPCRLPDGSRERDLTLICPCNFKTNPSWNEKGQCKCGLFVKK